MRAYQKELAVDHLNRLLGKSILDRLIQQSGVAEDGHASGTNQPQGSGEGRGPDTDWNADNEQSSVELRCSEAGEAQVQVATLQQVDSVKTHAHKENVEQQRQVGQQAVDAENNKNDGIVAGKVGQVVVDTALGFSEIGRLGHALDVEEFRDRTEVGESRAQRGAAEAVEAVAKARGDRINWDRDGHCVRRGREEKKEKLII